MTTNHASLLVSTALTSKRGVCSSPVSLSNVVPFSPNHVPSIVFECSYFNSPTPMYMHLAHNVPKFIYPFHQQLPWPCSHPTHDRQSTRCFRVFSHIQLTSYVLQNDLICYSVYCNFSFWPYESMCNQLRVQVK